MSIDGSRLTFAAWKSYDREQIGALFSDDAVYRYHPYDEPVERRGREVLARRGRAGTGGRIDP